MNSPEATSRSPDLMGEAGSVSMESTKTFLRNDMAELQAFIARVLTMLPRQGA